MHKSKRRAKPSANQKEHHQENNLITPPSHAKSIDIKMTVTARIAQTYPFAAIVSATMNWTSGKRPKIRINEGKGVKAAERVGQWTASTV